MSKLREEEDERTEMQALSMYLPKDQVEWVDNVLSVRLHGQKKRRSLSISWLIQQEKQRVEKEAKNHESK